MSRAENRLDLHLLGGFRLSVGERLIAPGAWGHRRAADLVKLLALMPGHRLTRDEVLEALCPHLDPDAAAAALYKAASIARRVLGDPETIVVRGGDVALAPQDVVVTDVETFEEAARAALESNDAEACGRAAALYAGELLPEDRYAEWAAPHRERLAARHLELLRAAGAWERVVAHDPLDENAHIALMRLYASVGKRAAALAQFRKLRRVLAEDLGVPPSAEAVALRDELSRGPAIHAPVSSSHPIEGREKELARARALFHRVSSERGHTLLVRGVPGIGKTRFCEAVLVDAAERTATTLRGTARFDGPGSYAPVVEALDSLLLARPELAAELTEPVRHALARLGAGPLLPSPDGEGAIPRQRILSSTSQLLTLAAAERPLVVFFDDLHEADESTLRLVHYLAEHARFHRILLVAAFRSDGGAALARVRSALLAQRAATEIELTGLGRPACARIIARVAGGEAPAATADAICERAAGNPLFTELLADSIRADGSIDLPENVHAVMDEMLERAGPRVAGMLERVAALGDRVQAEELLAIADSGEEGVFEWLDEALRAGILDEVPGGYRFHPPLLREALLEKLPTHRRKQAHRRAARALTDTGAPAARVARQLLLAGDDREASAWFSQAAQEEEQASAYRSALSYLDLALAHGPRTAELLERRADLLAATGDPAAPEAYADALAEADEPRRSSLTVRKARAHVALGENELALTELAGVEPPTRPDERVRFLVTRAMLDWGSGDLDAADRAATEARALATDPNMVVEAVVASGLVAHGRGDFAALLRDDLLNASAALERGGGLVAAAIQDGHVCAAEHWLHGGDPYREIARFARDLLETATRSGARRAAAFAMCVLGETELLTGELAKAERDLNEAAELAVDVRSLCTASVSLQRLAETRLRKETGEDVEALLDRALSLARESPIGQRHLFQRIYGTRIAAAGSLDEALAVIDEAEVALMNPADTCVGCLINFALPAAGACARAGKLDESRSYIDTAAKLAQTFWRGGAWHAAVDEARGVLLASEGRREAAREHFGRAEAIFAEIGQPLDAARCARAEKALS